MSNHKELFKLADEMAHWYSFLPDKAIDWSERTRTIAENMQASEAIASSLEGQAKDSARLDALERDIAEDGPIVLHNGEGTSGNYRGLGMANTGRTLRDAIDGLALYVYPSDRTATQQEES